MGISMQNLSAPDDVQQAGLGDLCWDGGNCYQYFVASGAIDAYDLVTADEAFTAVVGTTTTSGARPTACAIPQFAVADGQFFWAPVGPFGLKSDGTAFQVNALVSCAADVKLYTTATDGHVDDAATDLVAGLVLTTAVGSGGAAAAPCTAVQKLVTNCQD